VQKIKFSESARGPLDGVKVLDLSRLYVGNVLTHHLADFGADVLKIEQSAGIGDPVRALRDGGYAVSWKITSRNKRSLAIDLKHKDGVAALLELVRDAAILVENFRPGDLEKFGLGPDVLHRINPKLVVVRVSGWGATGPYRHKLGFGTLIEAFSGFAAKSGSPGGPPLLPSLGLADLICGLTGGMATMVALREAEREGGRGQVIDMSILDSMVAALGRDPAAYVLTGQLPERLGSRSTIAVPRNLYRTRDGRFMALAGSTQMMTKRIFAAIGRAELIDDPRFCNNDVRVRHADEVDQMIEAFTLERTLAENLAHFEERQITVGPVNDVAMLLADPHIIERGVIVEVDDEETGTIPMPAPPVRLSETPATFRRPAPKLGEHSRDVLRGLGWSHDRIDGLVAAGVVKEC
jgi:crotonobetainyl-CoA:carnitine CoA-transferase CaiB-like acyl-CoA transferase